MRRLQMRVREAYRPACQADSFCRNRQTRIADLPQRARQALAGAADKVIGGHPHSVEAKRCVMAAVQRFKPLFDGHTGGMRINYQQRTALSVAFLILNLNQGIEKIGIAAAGNVRLAPGHDKRAIGGRHGPREVRHVVGFGEGKTGTLGAAEQGLQIQRCQRFRATGQHAGAGTENIAIEARVISGQGISHHGHCQQPRFAAAERLRLAHGEESGIARGTRHAVANRRSCRAARSQFSLVRYQHIRSEALGALP